MLVVSMTVGCALQLVAGDVHEGAERIAQHGIQERAEAEIPLEKVTEGWAMGTDPEAHVKVLSDLFDSGATGVHIHSGQHDQRRVIEFYGKEVLPRLRKAAAKAA